MFCETPCTAQENTQEWRKISKQVHNPGKVDAEVCQEAGFLAGYDHGSSPERLWALLRIDLKFICLLSHRAAVAQQVEQLNFKSMRKSAHSLSGDEL